jgi:integrase
MHGKPITKRHVDALLPTNREYFVWDRDLKGFGLRVQPTGEKSYVVKYRPGGGRKAPTRRVTLGRVGTITPDEARKLAKVKLGSVAHGLDPAAVKAAERGALTLKELTDLFLSEHVEAKRKPATASHYRDILQRIVLPELGTRQGEKITTADLARLHVRMKRRPYQANRMLAVVGSLYAFASKRKLVPGGFNPVRGIDKYPEKGRERFLSGQELARLGGAIREAETVGIPWQVDTTKPTAKHIPKEKNGRTVIGKHAAAAIRLLIFTGARLREILHLRWEDVDLERGLLSLPDSKTGKKAIVLNAPAMTVLASLPHVGAYVIAGQDAGTQKEKPRSDLNKPWRSVAKRAGLAGLRIHDLRHTHASFGAGAGLGLPIIGKLLGHARPATTQRYAHLDSDPLRRASEQIGVRLATALGEPPKRRRTRDVVVAMRHRG